MVETIFPQIAQEHHPTIKLRLLVNTFYNEKVSSMSCATFDRSMVDSKEILA